MSPHRVENPEALGRPSGHNHAVVAAPGRLVAISGQNGHDAEGRLPDGDIVEHFDRAARNVVLSLEAAGARPEHIISMQIFVRDGEEYASAMADIAPVYRRHFGRHYPAMGLLVTGLLDPKAKVELVPLAVIPAEDDQ